MAAPGSILVVDDNKDSRELLAEYLAFHGFEVTIAQDGGEAVDRTVELRPDLVLMDLALPGLLDGWEATRRIRSDPRTQYTTVVAVTAHAFPQMRERAMHAGCQAVFTKPVDLRTLMGHIEGVMTRRRSARST